MKKATNIIVGLLVIAAGVIFALNALEITSIDIFFDGWWTLFIIVPCAAGIFKSKEKLANIFAILLGVALLLAEQNYIEYDVMAKLLLPVIIVLIGIKIVSKSLTRKEKEKVSDDSAAVFCGREADFSGQKIECARLAAIFGGVNAKLTNAEIEQNGQLDLFCLFGGADIYVPENVNIKVSAFCLFGGVNDKRENKCADENSPTLTINGFCMFGGADIK